MFQMKDQNKTSGEELQEVEISHQPKKEFKVTVVKTIEEHRRRKDEQGMKVRGKKIFLTKRKYKGQPNR